MGSLRLSLSDDFPLLFNTGKGKRLDCWKATERTHENWSARVLVRGRFAAPPHIHTPISCSLPVPIHPLPFHISFHQFCSLFLYTRPSSIPIATGSCAVPLLHVSLTLTPSHARPSTISTHYTSTPPCPPVSCLPLHTYNLNLCSISALVHTTTCYPSISPHHMFNPSNFSPISFVFSQYHI